MLEYIFLDTNSNGSSGKPPAILLSMSRASDRKLIRKNIPDHFDVIDEEKPPTNLKYDLCISDLQSFRAHREELLNTKNQALPVFLPLVLLVENSKALKHDPDIWDQVDDVIEVPVPMKMLNMRIKNQLRSRKHSLQIARQNEKLSLLKKAVHSTEVGVLITDAQAEDNPIIFSNEGFSTLTGYSQEEIRGRNCRFLQNDDRDQKSIDDIRDMIKNEQSGKRIIRNYKKDGTPFWNELSISPVRNSQNKVTHFIGIQNDVTELIETQKELKEEKDLLRLVTENSVDMISRHTLDGTYLYVTPSCEQLMGYTPDELIGKNALDYIHPDDIEALDEAHKILHDNPEEDKTVAVVCRKKTKSGAYKWVETISRASVNPEDHSIVEVQANTRDISTRKKYEDELKEALDEKNVLLQEIHHRVKNNLAVISGLLQIQQFDSDNEHLNKILGNSISRIKSMALIHEKLYQSKSLSHMEFKEYIEDLVQSIGKSHDLNDRISMNLDCDSIKLNVNQAVPCALIVNEVISNAIEHAFPNKQEGSIWIQFKEDGKQLSVSIKDNGIGIPDEVLSGEKSSMGMTIVETLIKQLNAKDEFTNDDGTEFKFTFTRQDIKGAHSRFL